MTDFRWEFLTYTVACLVQKPVLVEMYWQKVQTDPKINKQVSNFTHYLLRNIYKNSSAILIGRNI